MPDSSLKEKDIEELHFKADEELLKYSNKISTSSGVDTFFHLSKYEFLECFEEDCHNMIPSCFITEQLVKKEKVRDFDYSLCSVGFWKTLEIELNIILVDTIRLLKKIVNSIPSNGISLKNGKHNVFGGYKYFKGIEQKYYIDINKKKNDKLLSLMFGDLIRITEYHDSNDLNDIIYKINVELQNVENIKEFMEDFIIKIKTVVYEYRNECSHTGIMKLDEYERLKKLIFDEDGLYKKVSILKESINQIF